MTRHEALRAVQGQLQAAGLEDPAREARYLIEAVLALPKGALTLEGHVELTPDEEEGLQAWALRRAHHEPLSRIQGSREFWGLTFALSPDTLDPRGDSETLIEAVLAPYPDRTLPLTFLDLGTGTGCLLISLLKEFPKAQGIGVDLAFGAASTARRNAQTHQVDARTLFIQSSWVEALKGPFDVILSNPPYIPLADKSSLGKNVLDFDPSLALFGGEDGLTAYRHLARALPPLLNKNGRVFFEIGQGQETDVTALMEASGFTLKSSHRDLQGIIRILEFIF